MSYILLEEPLTAEHCRNQPNQFVTGIVTVNLSVVIENTFEGFLNVLEFEMLGDVGILTDIEYKVVGNGMDDMLHIRVTGFADLIGDYDPSIYN